MAKGTPSFRGRSGKPNKGRFPSRFSITGSFWRIQVVNSPCISKKNAPNTQKYALFREPAQESAYSKDPPVLKIVRRANSLRVEKCQGNSKTLRRVLRSACFQWGKRDREINQHPNLPWNYITHGFLDPSAFPEYCFRTGKN